jgi:hypothetical protein
MSRRFNFACNDCDRKFLHEKAWQYHGSHTGHSSGGTGEKGGSMSTVIPLSDCPLCGGSGKRGGEFCPCLARDDENEKLDDDDPRAPIGEKS